MRCRWLIAFVPIYLLFLFPFKLHAQWSSDPTLNTPVSALAGFTRNSVKSTDGIGGIFIVWPDWRNDPYPNPSDLYMQHVDSRGYSLWTDGGIPLITKNGEEGLSYKPLVADGSDGVLVFWSDSTTGEYNIYGNRIRSDGVKAWGDSGIVICGAPGNQKDAWVVSDSNGGAIICWLDTRNGNSDIFAQRIDSSGNTLWVNDGVAVCTLAGTEESPWITEDGKGGAFVSWDDSAGMNTFDMYAQHLNSSGQITWANDGVRLVQSPRFGYFGEMVADTEGNVIVIWNAYKTSDHDILAQKLDSNGNRLWGNNGVILCSANQDQLYPQVAGDGSGGALVAWWDFRNIPDTIVYSQHVSSSGNILWQVDGIRVCTASRIQERVVVTSDLSGGLFIVWDDKRSGSKDIYGQHLDPLGRLLWQNDGLPISIAPDAQWNDAGLLVSDGERGLIVTWTDFRPGSDGDIYAQRVLYNGTLPTPGTIAGLKFNDINDNGIFDPADSLLRDWKIILRDTTGSIVDSVMTDSLGMYEFLNLADNTYGVSDVQEQGWYPSLRSEFSPSNVAISSGTIRPNLNLGSVLGFRFIHTLGLWSDTASWISLRTPRGSDAVVIPESAIASVDTLPLDSILSMRMFRNSIVEFQNGVSALTIARGFLLDDNASLIFHDSSFSSGLYCFSDLQVNGKFSPGSSTISFWGDEIKFITTRNAPLGVRFYNLCIRGKNTYVEGSLHINHTLSLANDLNLIFGDTVYVDTENFDAIQGKGKFTGGTVLRKVANNSFDRFRFESESTYVRFNGISNPSSVTMTSYPGTTPPASEHWHAIYSYRNDGSTNTIAVDCVDKFSRWAIGVIKPNQDSTGFDTTFVRRYYDIVAKPDSGFCATLSLRYDQSEVPVNVNEDSLKIFRLDGLITDIAQISTELPHAYVLEQSYPNPFNPTTTIRYQLPVESHVTLQLYNMLGQLVATLVDGIEYAGVRSKAWNAKTITGAPVASGVYFYKIEAKGTTNNSQSYTQVRKMVFIR
jgi:hypothetical protein